MVLYREVGGYSDRSLLVGTHLPSVDILSELERLSWALIFCLIISVLSALAAGFIGHQIAKPVRRLSEGAAKVHDLDLASVAPIEGSFFASSMMPPTRSTRCWAGCAGSSAMCRRRSSSG
jgi:hypothetical protein